MPTFRVVTHPRLPDPDACWTYPSPKRFTSRDEADRYANMLADSVWASVVQEGEEATLDGLTILNGFAFKPSCGLYQIDNAPRGPYLVVAADSGNALMRVYAHACANSYGRADDLHGDMCADVWEVRDVLPEDPVYRLMLAYAHVRDAIGQDH